MREECELFLKMYRFLNAEYADDSKLPLSPRAWPDVNGQVWSYPQLSLYCLKTRFDWFVTMMKLGCQEAEWPEPAIINTKAGNHMVDILANLEKCQRFLEAKIAELDGP